MNATLLPSSEYQLTFTDGSVSLLGVHPHESLEQALREMLQAAGAGPEEVASVELLRTYDLAEEFGSAATR